MENILAHVRNSIIETDKIIDNEIECIKKVLEEEADAPIVELLKIKIKIHQYMSILNKGVINNILDINFYRSCFKNMKIKESELIDLVKDITVKYNLEENLFLTLCDETCVRIKKLTYFFNLLEDSVLHPEKYPF